MEVIVAQIVTNFDEKVDSLLEMFAMEGSSNKLIISKVEFLEVEESTFEGFDIKIINNSLIKGCLAFLKS
jgi:hypothetical protein